MTTLGWIIIGTAAAVLLLVFTLSLAAVAARADRQIEAWRKEREL